MQSMSYRCTLNTIRIYLLGSQCSINFFPSAPRRRSLFHAKSRISTFPTIFICETLSRITKRVSNKATIPLSRHNERSTPKVRDRDWSDPAAVTVSVPRRNSAAQHTRGSLKCRNGNRVLTDCVGF
ncbi:hypothetical protein PUN28_004168 [Cardiocondyla obscurior]|uniref:Uncharacterized protein n=1 Tax=Cardiocondyla obscurior TaxID=286306 RepID=A0AAW2GPT8_9HYME